MGISDPGLLYSTTFLLTIVIHYRFVMSSTAFEAATFSCAIRGYRVYRNIWQPKESETLQCYHESDNDYGLFAIKACRDAEFHRQIVGDLPLEMSRLTKFLLDHGATVTTTFSGTHCLEIPCVVNAKLTGTKKNKKI